MAPSLTPS